MKDLTKIMSEIVLEAGAKLLSMKSDNLKRISKGLRDFATEADLISQEIIVSKLNENFPESFVLAEEQEFHTISEKSYFVVDPLDGTFNYALGFDTWGVLLSYVKESQPYAGVIYLPEKGVIITGEVGKGAFVNDVPVTLSKIDNIEEAILNIELGSWLSPEVTSRYAVPLINKVLVSRSIGCAAVDFYEMFIGASSACVIILGSKIWDVSAGAAILKESGGVFSTIDGADIVWDTIAMPGVFSSNSLIHKEIINTLNNNSDLQKNN